MDLEKLSERLTGIKSQSLYKKVLPSVLDLTIKNFLYKLYLEKSEIQSLRVNTVFGIGNPDTPVVMPPNVHFIKDNRNFVFTDWLIFFSVTYRSELYTISFYLHNTFRGHENGDVELFVYLVGTSTNAIFTDELFDLISKESIKSNGFINKTIRYENTKDDEFYKKLKIQLPEEVSLDSIFISERKYEQIQRFIYAVKNFNRDKICLRYLFSGKPGTAKTDLINAIINKLLNQATVLFTNGSSFPLVETFSFCNHFEPCILVVDDIDFAIKDRSEGSDIGKLGIFLQQLDGFFSNNLFVLAATNDKMLVDVAASRPGRFDLILDLNEIEPDNYIRLINRETTDEHILNFFNEDILQNLKYKKVTGAFIVSFIKQLISAKKLKGDLTEVDFNSYFELIHKGFYNNNAEGIQTNFGFN